MGTPAPYVYRALILSVYDGDTVTAEIDLGMNIKRKVSCRLMGIDTPEIRGKTAYEKDLAKVARDRVRALIMDKWVILHSVAKPDKYGRLLAKIWDDDHGYVNQLLLDEGLAHEYDGGTKQLWEEPV